MNAVECVLAWVATFGGVALISFLLGGLLGYYDARLRRLAREREDEEWGYE